MIMMIPTNDSLSVSSIRENEKQRFFVPLSSTQRQRYSIVKMKQFCESLEISNFPWQQMVFNLVEENKKITQTKEGILKK